MLIVALSRRPGRGCAIVDVDGDLDAFNCRLLGDTLAQAADGRARDVIVDLCAVRSFSAAGLHCIEHAAATLRRCGGRLGLVCPAGSPAHLVLRAAGMHRRWPMHADVEEAVRLAAEVPQGVVQELGHRVR
jgi:anti-sigma B factor antagonist